jgi:hypothetical protein
MEQVRPLRPHFSSASWSVLPSSIRLELVVTLTITPGSMRTPFTIKWLCSSRFIQDFLGAALAFGLYPLHLQFGNRHLEGIFAPNLG